MRVIYFIYQVCIALPLFLAATILTALATVLGTRLGNGHFWGYFPGKIWSRITCFLLLIPVRVKGRELLTPGQSYVFVANHQGSMDIFLIYGYLNRNFKWMMKKSLRKVPFVGKACEAASHVFVDKSGPKKIQATYERAYHILQDGTSLVVFPEGARTFTGHMGFFRKGAFQLADELQLPVVPLTINGSFDILPRTHTFLKWYPLELTIHPPIFPIGKGTENVNHALEESYQVIMDGLIPAYQGKVDNPDQ